MRPALFALAALLPAVAFAQTPTSSARAIGMAGAYTTLARGYEAVAWNPAMLGMPGRPGFSLNILQAAVTGYSDAFGPGDFDRWSSGTWTTATKDSILDRVRDGDPDGTLQLGSGLDATGISLSLGGFAVTLSGFGQFQGAVADDAVELALFGNASRRAPGQTYDLDGTQGDMFGGASVAISYGTRLRVAPTGILAIGATARYTRGVLVGRFEDVGTSLRNAPTFDAAVRVHGLVSDVDESTNQGTGWAFDVGGAYALTSGLRVGLVIENLLNGFSWSDDHLEYYRYDYRLTQAGDTYDDITIAEIEGVPFNPGDATQAALRDALFADAHPATRVRAGASVDLGGLVVAGDLGLRLREGVLDAGNKRLAAGAELTLIPVLRPRFGLATDLSGGFSYAGGLGLAIGPVKADLGLTVTPGGDRKGFVLAVGLAIIS